MKVVLVVVIQLVDHVRMKKNSDFIEIFLVNVCRIKKRLYLCNRIRETTIASDLGSVDEWLSQRSAKPCTAVRIRQEPQRKEVWVSGGNHQFAKLTYG